MTTTKVEIATKFTPTAEGFALARQAGFRRAELWTDADVLARWQQVVELARPHGLDLALHFPNRLDQSSETLRQAVDLYGALDCRALVLHQPHMDRHGADLLALNPSLRLAVENHKLTREGFERWATDNPGLTLDVEHLWWYTLPDEPLAGLLRVMRDFLARFAGKLYHVHLPGYLPGQDEHRPMYCSRDMVVEVLNLLEDVGFTGLVVSEVNLEYQNEYDLQMDVLLFRRWQALRGGAAARA